MAQVGLGAVTWDFWSWFSNSNCATAVQSIPHYTSGWFAQPNLGFRAFQRRLVRRQSRPNQQLATPPPLHAYMNICPYYAYTTAHDLKQLLHKLFATLHLTSPRSFVFGWICGRFSPINIRNFPDCAGLSFI